MKPEELAARADIAAMVQDYFATHDKINFADEIPNVIKTIEALYPEATGPYYKQFVPQEIAWYCGINLIQGE